MTKPIKKVVAYETIAVKLLRTPYWQWRVRQ